MELQRQWYMNCSDPCSGGSTPLPPLCLPIGDVSNGKKFLSCYQQFQFRQFIHGTAS